MKKKSLISMIAMLTVLSASIAGCSGKSTSETAGSASSVVSEAEEETEDVTVDEELQDGSAAEAEDNEAEAGEEEQAAFSPITAVDNEECSIIVTDLKDDAEKGIIAELEYQNKSAEKTYMFTASDIAVNGISAGSLYAGEVEASEEKSETIYLSDILPEDLDIDEITDLELSFTVYDVGSWEAEPAADETIHIYPKGEDQAYAYHRQSEEKDVLLAENDQVKVVLIGTEADTLWGYALKLYIENKTESPIMFDIGTASLNGTAADPYWAQYLNGRKVFFTEVSWPISSLEESGITDPSEITEVVFELSAYYDDFSADVLNETITLRKETLDGWIFD